MRVESPRTCTLKHYKRHVSLWFNKMACLIRAYRPPAGPTLPLKRKCWDRHLAHSVFGAFSCKMQTHCILGGVLASVIDQLRMYTSRRICPFPSHAAGYCDIISDWRSCGHIYRFFSLFIWSLLSPTLVKLKETYARSCALKRTFVGSPPPLSYTNTCWT